MKIMSDEQYKTKKIAEANKYLKMSSVEGQNVGHMEKDVLISFMMENGYNAIEGKSSMEFSNGSVRLAVDSSGIICKASGAKGGFNMKTYLSRSAQSNYGDREGTEWKKKCVKCQSYSSNDDLANNDNKCHGCGASLSGVGYQLVDSSKGSSRLDRSKPFPSLMASTACDCTTEKQLGAKDDQGPDSLTEKQIEKDHKDEKAIPTEKRLEKARKSGFNMKDFLSKSAHYEGVQGYMVSQTRAWQNCVKCKQDAGKSAQESWQECINEYSGKKSNDEWSYEYASDVSDKIKKKASCECTTEKQLGAKDEQGPDEITENQIEKDRKDEQEITTEKQLAKVRKEACSTTEKQLGDKWTKGKEVNTVTENQIDKDHKGEEEITTEKRLEKVRKKAGNTAGHCPECGALHGRHNDDHCKGDLRCDECKKHKKHKTSSTDIDSQALQAIDNFCRTHDLFPAVSPVISETSIGLLFNFKKPNTPNTPSPSQLFHDFRNEINWTANGRMLTLRNNKGGEGYTAQGMTKDSEHTASSKIQTIAQSSKSMRAFDGAQENYDNMTPPEDDGSEYEIILGNGKKRIVLEVSGYEEADEDGKSWVATLDKTFINEAGERVKSRMASGISVSVEFSLKKLLEHYRSKGYIELKNISDEDEGAEVPVSEASTTIVTKEAQTAQYQMGLYWNRIKKKQDAGLTPGQAVMAVLAEMEKDGDKIVVQA